MTLPASVFRRAITPAWRHPLVWRADHLSLNALTGQTGTLVRATTGVAEDSFGVARTLVHSQPRWQWSVTSGPGHQIVSLRLGGGVTEYLSWNLDILPQAMTVMVDFIEFGTIAIVNGCVFSLGSAAFGTPRFYIVENGGKYAIAHHNGTTDVTQTLAAAPSIGDRVRLRAILNANGSVQLHQSVNGAAETSTSASGSLAFGSAWAGTPPTFRLNAAGTGNIGQSHYVGAVAALGVQPQATMLAVLT